MDGTSLTASSPQDMRGDTEQASPPGKLDEELVRKVADRVYRLLLQDLKVEQERLRLVSKKAGYHKGGR